MGRTYGRNEQYQDARTLQILGPVSVRDWAGQERQSRERIPVPVRAKQDQCTALQREWQWEEVAILLKIYIPLYSHRFYNCFSHAQKQTELLVRVGKLLVE